MADRTDREAARCRSFTASLHASATRGVARSQPLHQQPGLAGRLVAPGPARPRGGPRVRTSRVRRSTRSSPGPRPPRGGLPPGRGRAGRAFGGAGAAASRHGGRGRAPTPSRCATRAQRAVRRIPLGPPARSAAGAARVRLHPRAGRGERNAFDRLFVYYRWRWLLERRLLFKRGPLGGRAGPQAGRIPARARAPQARRRGFIRLEDLRAPARSLRTLPALPPRDSAPDDTLVVLPKRYRSPTSTLPGEACFQLGGEAVSNTIGQSGEFLGLRDYRLGRRPAPHPLEGLGQDRPADREGVRGRLLPALRAGPRQLRGARRRGSLRGGGLGGGLLRLRDRHQAAACSTSCSSRTRPSW